MSKLEEIPKLIRCVGSTTLISPIYYLSSNFMKYLGSKEEWIPNDEKFKLKHIGNKIYSFITVLQPGCYEYKITEGSWDNSYGITKEINCVFEVKIKSAVVIYFNEVTKVSSQSIVSVY